LARSSLIFFWCATPTFIIKLIICDSCCLMALLSFNDTS
jgi:hypothetical protein